LTQLHDCAEIYRPAVLAVAKTECFIDTIYFFFFGLCPSSHSFFLNTMFRKPSLLSSSGKEVPNLVGFLDWAESLAQWPTI